MTPPAKIAALLLRTALALLLMAQVAHAGATALRMELGRSGGGAAGFVVICTPGGLKFVAAVELTPQAPESSVECTCPSATACGTCAVTAPGSTSVKARTLTPNLITPRTCTSFGHTSRIAMCAGSPRSPPALSS